MRDMNREGNVKIQRSTVIRVGRLRTLNGRRGPPRGEQATVHHSIAGQEGEKNQGSQRRPITWAGHPKSSLEVRDGECAI